MRKHMEWVVFTGTFRQVVNLDCCTHSGHSYKETAARGDPWVELSPKRYLAVIIMGQCDAQIIFSLRVHGIALGGMEVLILHISQAELVWVPEKLEEMWSPAHLAVPTMEAISLKTKPRRSWTVHLHNRSREQRTQDGTYSLDAGQPQNQLCGLRATNRIYFCGGMLKQVRPWECHMSVFILSAADKCTEVSSKIRQLISVFLPSISAKLILQTKQQAVKNVSWK